MATTRIDYYEVLQVDRTATASEIKRAFRQQVRSCHPDTNPGDADAERRFKELNEAYSVLSDADKRAHYDRFGTVDGNGSPFNGFGGGGMEDLFGDLFGNLFGGGFGPRSGPAGPERGADLQMGISITLEEAAQGVTRTVKIPRWENCDHCEGQGAEPGSSVRQCSTCGGSGQVRQRVNTLFGQTVTVGACPSCAGSGKIIEEPCRHCHGEGRERRVREQDIKIQPGVDTGTRLRVAGSGESGFRGGPPGDLFIAIEVRDHPRFQRDGKDLHCRLDVDWPLAVLGGSCTVETLIDGTQKVDITAASQPGSTVRLKGMGMPLLRGNGRGDLYAHLSVRVPKAADLSEKAQTHLSDLAQEMGFAPPEEGEGLLTRIFGSKKKSRKKKSK